MGNNLEISYADFLYVILEGSYQKEKLTGEYPQKDIHPEMVEKLASMSRLAC